MVSQQQEVRLNAQNQNVLVQKIANIAGTGEDNVSYKKAKEKIDKRQREEIGTSRSQGRPINIVKEEKYKIQDEIGELEEFKNKQYELEEVKKQIETDINKEEKTLQLLKELKQAEDLQELEKQKLEFNRSIIKSNDEKLNGLTNQKQIKEDELEQVKITEKKEKKENKKNYTSIVCAIFTVLFVVLALVLKNNKILFAVMSICLGLSIFVLLFSIIARNNKMKKAQKAIHDKEDEINRKRQELQVEIDKINSQIELLNKSSNEQQEEIKKQKDILDIQKENKKQEIIRKYNMGNFEYSNLSFELDKVQNAITQYKLKLHQLDLDKNNIMPKLEKLAEMEENLEDLNQKEEALNKENEAIELAKEMLEIAYKKMKENVTPKFTKELSENISKISNEKYKNVRINDEEGIIVEKENGEYISCEKLSIGTIDQLYMSLRFSAIKELSQETMPIILDEAFAYYDEERLENILNYIKEEFKDNQVIIFTCTNREKEILEKGNVEMNYIKL